MDRPYAEPQLQVPATDEILTSLLSRPLTLKRLSIKLRFDTLYKKDVRHQILSHLIATICWVVYRSRLWQLQAAGLESVALEVSVSPPHSPCDERKIEIWMGTMLQGALGAWDKFYTCKVRPYEYWAEKTFSQI